MIDSRPLRYPAFRRLWLSGIVSVSGAQLTAIAVPMQIYAITGSSAYVGLAGLVILAPLVVFGLWGGAFADVADRRKLMIISSAAMSAATALLCGQALLQLNNVWLLYAILLVQQACIAVNQPTRNAILPRILPARQLPAANTLEMTVIQLGGIIGSLLAGVLIAFGGLALAYLLDSLAMLATVWAACRLPALPPASGTSSSGVKEIWFGLKYVWSHKLMMSVFAVDLIAMVAGLPRALFPELSQQLSPSDSEMVAGLLFAAIAIGSVLAGLLSGWVGRVRRHGLAVIAGVLIWGTGLAGFGLSMFLGGAALPFAILFLGIAGAGDLVSVVFRSTMIQQIATDEVRGRLQGLFNVSVAAGQRLGDVSHGAAAALCGPIAATAGGGGLVIALTLVLLTMVPAIYRFRAGPDLPAPAPV